MLKTAFPAKHVIFKIHHKILNGLRQKELEDPITQICNMDISKYIKSFLIIILITSCSEVSDIDKFNLIVDEQWNKVISDNPVYASSMGDLSRNQDWGDSSLRKLFQDHEYEKEMLIELESINPKSFSEDDLTNYRLFVKQVSESVEMQQYKLYLLPFSHRGGIQLLHDTTSVLPLDPLITTLTGLNVLKKFLI